MWPLLAIQALLIAVSGGNAKPYCSWKEEKGICLETADVAEPNNAIEGCADDKYPALILDIQYCFRQQSPLFTGCLPGTDGRCEPYEYLKLVDDKERHAAAHAPRQIEPDEISSLCLPVRPAAARAREVRLRGKMKARSEVLTVLTAVNVCEGRGPAAAKSTTSLDELSISAPCTCSNTGGAGLTPFNASVAPLCDAVAVLPEASGQCGACSNDWDVWLNDYLGRLDCLRTAWAAAPIQAFCRSATTREACAKVNANCGPQCGGNQTERIGAVPEAAPVDEQPATPKLLQGAEGVDSAASSGAVQERPASAQGEAADAADMSSAWRPTAGSPAAAAAAAAAAALLAARAL